MKIKDLFLSTLNDYEWWSMNSKLPSLRLKFFALLTAIFHPENSFDRLVPCHVCRNKNERYFYSELNEILIASDRKNCKFYSSFLSHKLFSARSWLSWVMDLVGKGFEHEKTWDHRSLENLKKSFRDDFWTTLCLKRKIQKADKS